MEKKIMLTFRQDQPKTQYSPFQFDLSEDPPPMPFIGPASRGEPMTTSRPFSGI
ncbi:hypothetical protein L211DRAFT_842498 [Terfezia boudieri ATCC MYA-4762]|uniref:Uncharacterized protein n=1 Tax=Terfezia boudieri ATCC MYA-4762 TaxID=1051890 RepID=A0A3N4LD19_9PEZI|nr:hypothetical protein L211DRAFT_842498 [Terfezia boudieri ATCC MYA-4762]